MLDMVCLLFSVLYVVIIRFFFFKQKTAYEMRISDWSSDVCSSDLLYRCMKAVDSVAEPPQHGWRHRMGGDVPVQPRIVRKTQLLEQPFDRTPFAVESEPAISVAGDCLHGAIERGCGSPVEPQLGRVSGISSLPS